MTGTPSAGTEVPTAVASSDAITGSTIATPQQHLGGRAAVVRDLKILKAPEEGGGKKEYEDFLERIQNHVIINWTFGTDIGELVKTMEEPKIEEPQDLTDEQEKVKWKTRLWAQNVDRYGMRMEALESNKSALYALMTDGLSKVIKSKVRSKDGFKTADTAKDVKWLLGTLEDIIVNFEEVKPNTLAIDDQMERIMKMKQGDMSNEDFLKLLSKELKVYEKHGGDFLWTKTKQKQFEAHMVRAELEQYQKSGTQMSTQEKKDTGAMIKTIIKEEITAMAFLKRADKKRYGNLLINLKNSYLLGKDDYPTTAAGVLKVLNNYQQEWAGGANSPNQQSAGGTARKNPGISFFQAAAGENLCFLRGTNGSFFPDITCRLCHIKGHYQTHCPVAINAHGDHIKGYTGSEGRYRGRGGSGSGKKSGDDDKSDGKEKESKATDKEVSEKCGVLLSQRKTAYINPLWVLLDSESTDHIFCNPELLTDIEPTTDGEYLRLHTASGTIDTHQKAKFGELPVWYNPACLANILSLSLVTDQYRVTFDSEDENAFRVHISAGHVITFERYQPGLYYLDASSINLSKLRSAFSFLNLNTVESNKKLFRTRDVRKANEALTLNRRTNHIAKDKFIRVVQSNRIRNCPVTVGDIRRSHAIYGPPIPPIKGRTRYEESPRVRETEIMQLPKELYDDLKHVTLCADFHYVNGVCVFHTISRTINYRTVSFPLSRSAQSIANEMKEVYQKYNARGFKITEVHADKEFEKAENDLLPVRLRVCGVDDHVPEVERSIQTQKNENRTVCYAMPYKCIPRLMVREIIMQGNEFLNAFGTKDDIGDGLTPRNIIDNLPHVDYTDLKYEFGQYVQLHVTQKKTNTMASRTIGAIVLGPKKIQGTYNFMSLETGAQINGRVVAQLPVTSEIIARVESLGEDQAQPYRHSRMLQYEWRPGQPIDNDDAAINDELNRDQRILPAPVNQDMNIDDSDHLDFLDEVGNYSDNDSLPDDQQGAYGHNPWVVENNLWVVEDADAPDQNQGAAQGHEDPTSDEDQGAHLHQIHQNQGAQDQQPEALDASIHDQDTPDNEEASIPSNASSSDEGFDTDDEETEIRRDTERNRRRVHFEPVNTEEYGRGKPRERKTTDSLSFLQTRFEDLDSKNKNEFLRHALDDYHMTGKTSMLERYTAGFVFAQLSVKQGLAKYGKEAELKLIAEFKQLLDYKTFHGRKADELSIDQKRKAANMINLIEEKLNRGHTPENPVIRSRSCYNGKVQRGLYSKEQTASPTVSQDAFFLTAMVDALEGRDKAVTDIKGAYLNAKMKDEVLMRITGKEVDIFCDLDPSLNAFVTSVKDKKVLYVQLDRALYGCVQSALLWYELYSTTLKDMGYKLNPYDLCVANAEIEGSQCTICWYVDDNKISHKNPEVVSMVIKKIEAKFGKMSQTRGEEHDFLGMKIKFKDGKLKINMKKHIQKAIDAFSEDITRNAATPASNYLFEVREDIAKLSDSKADNFHSVTAALLFISRRCRLDIMTAVAFLTTRVSCPDEDDWKKLRRVLQYLRGTLDLELTLGADDITKVKSWVDVSYGIHQDCRSHTGGGMSWGWGMILSKSQKQKLNTKSSTEGEIVGVSDYLPNVIWARMFLEEQGFVLKENILYQDNQSSIKIEKNGKMSSGQKTKHMDNRYFWIKDRLSSEGIEVVYCPTEKMVADFFTKPLQGSLFRKFRDIILGYEHISTLNEVMEESLSEERVRKDEETKNVRTVKTANDGPSITRPKTYAEVVSGNM